MIWLYLFALLVAALGVGVVLLDWSRGIRRGFLVPLVMFSVAAYVAVNVISWIAVVDAGGESRPMAQTRGVGEGILFGGAREERVPAPSVDEPSLWSLSGWSRVEYLTLANVIASSLPTVLVLLGSRWRRSRPRHR